MLKEEEIFGIKDFKTYQKFGEKVYKIRENVLKNISKLKDKNKKIIGYGAPAKATTALNFFGISKETIKSHDKFREKFKIKFDLLSDEEIKVLKKYKVWGKKKFMGREFMGIIRSTILIDKKGKIIKVWNNVKVKDHAKEVLETLKSLN